MQCPMSLSLPLEPAASHPLPAALAGFHAWVAEWFQATHGNPTPCQVEAWQALGATPAGHVLVAAPTGSGKTLAAFLVAIDRLVREAGRGELPAATSVLYVSPLRALGNDIRQGLERPLAALAARAVAEGAPEPGIRIAVRTGDTPARERAAMRRQPPHLLVTTPESLYILLTSDSGRAALAGVHTVIVDELHATAGSKRGAHLALSLERLHALCAVPPVRIGLSATQRPVTAMARLLAGRGPDGEPRPCRIVDFGHVRARDLAIELPQEALAAVLSSEGWESVFARLESLIATHRATLVFVNTRRQAERIAHALSERMGADAVAAHHGSLSREQRLEAEFGLRNGKLRAVVATASLELGIDVGHVDLVCQIGATRQLSAFLQRAGRAGHAVDGVSKARLFPLSRDDLAECIALIAAIAAAEIDVIEIPQAPIDVLAQQCVAAIACEPMTAAALFQRMRAADPFHELTREQFDAVLGMLVEGFTTRRGRRGSWIFHDLTADELRARRGTRLMAIASGGAIPDTAQWEVRALPEDLLIGTLDEDFAIDTSIGDVFQLGATAWRVTRAVDGVVFVEDAAGQPPSIPFWFGEAPARSPELSAAVWHLRTEIALALGSSPGPFAEDALAALARRIGARPGVGEAAARQLVDYYAAALAVLGDLPTGDTLLAERFFDEAGGMQLVIHCPHGSRVNRAFGLALRKRFCRSFNFELQAAATEDAVILSLTEVHSFPLASIWQFLEPASLRDVLVQALLDVPMFATRWRWNAVCALALPRRQGGQRVAPRIQRMRAEDLVAAVFPDQLACLENLSGPRVVPEHPLVQQTIHDCLTEAMDFPRFEALIRAVRSGELKLSERDLPEPSPLAAEILSARPYAFLDDAPLEERRTLAVHTRRFVDPRTARDYAHLDDAAIARVCDEVWPRANTPIELHEALHLCGVFTEVEVQDSGWSAWMQGLALEGRAIRVEAKPGQVLWVAVERWFEVAAAFAADWPLPGVLAERAAAGGALPPPPDPAEACAMLLNDRLAVMGPVTVVGLSSTLGLDEAEIAAALAQLECAGQVLRGHFCLAATTEQWCDRRLLARIQRGTLDRLRAEVRPVAPTVLLDFLCRWQTLAGGRSGREGLIATLTQLSGWVAPASAWESAILPARVADYCSGWLDELSHTGQCCWQRARGAASDAQVAVRHMPVAWFTRTERMLWHLAPPVDATSLRPDAAQLHACLLHAGASFIDELTALTGWPLGRLASALAECVARGLAAADGFAGLRALAAGPRTWTLTTLGSGGRWHAAVSPAALPMAGDEDPLGPTAAIARRLLARWGVLFPRVLAREVLAPPWRELQVVLRRMEARGEVRGGRFVQGFVGEQYALPEALMLLRECARAPRSPPTLDPRDPINVCGLFATQTVRSDTGAEKRASSLRPPARVQAKVSRFP